LMGRIGKSEPMTCEVDAAHVMGRQRVARRFAMGVVGRRLFWQPGK
jgi:hypothetical protein